MRFFVLLLHFEDIDLLLILVWVIEAGLVRMRRRFHQPELLFILLNVVSLSQICG